MTSSGTTSFDPALGDLTLEAFARVQIHPASMTANHFFQARMSASLLLADWDVEPGPNLFKQVLQSIPMVPGVATYSVPSNVVAITDYYMRQFTVNTAVSLSNAFTTVLGSASVTVNQTNHGQSVGNWMGITVPIAIGGLLLLGFYQIATVVGVNSYTITATSNATASSGPGGSVPAFTTTSSSPLVSVALAKHGLVAGVPFSVQVSTAVGGLTLFGAYTVASVTNANVFVITAPQNASSGATVSENSGQALIANQTTGVDPTDRVITPLSRTDYAAQPNKVTPGFSTQVFFLRTINPTVTLWPVPDTNGPYTLYYWAVTQIEDAVMANGVTMNMPHRFLEAFAAGLAAKLARKFPPPPPTTVAELQAEAMQAWKRASDQDTEQGVPIYITPMIGSYYR